MGSADVSRLGGVVLIYWLMFGFPAVMAVVEQWTDRKRGQFGFAWMVAMIALVVLIGFRWETGGDWGNYNRMVEQALWTPQPLSFANEPGFTLLIRYAATTSYGMTVITMASGLLMTGALARFCLDQPRPWLCLTVSVPYLVVVMGMGYIRQGMAVSCLLLALVELRHGRVLRYAVWVVAGAMFHSTALVLLPLGLMSGERNLPLRVLFALLALGLLAYAVATARSDIYITNYVTAGMSSSGALVRLGMTALPAGIFLAYRRRFAEDRTERGVWTGLSIAALVALVALAVSPSSTVVDRLALYLLPLQCFVYARAPAVLARDAASERLITGGVLLLYALTFFVWLNFADNVSYWLPYRSYFFEDRLCPEC